MRIQKLLFLLICILSLAFCLLSFSACNKTSKIILNGEVEEKLQVNSEYVEKGVEVPDGYTVITDGYVFTDILGQYHIKYSIYSGDGEFVKELNRFVNVVDDTPPTYKERENIELYAGVVYKASDFFSEYNDNYNGTYIDFSPKEICFKSAGIQEVTITLLDKSNNFITYTKNINVIFDIPTLLNEKYKNQPDKIRTGTTGIDSDYINISINSNTSLGYYSSGSLHYLEKVPTNLGKSASIQISANYGEFNNANISFHINGKNTDKYSVGFANFDATQEYDVLLIQAFRSTINDLYLNTSEMLSELNNNLLKVLNNFKAYVNNELNIEFK